MIPKFVVVDVQTGYTFINNYTLETATEFAEESNGIFNHRYEVFAVVPVTS